MSVVIAIDPGLNASGVCVFDGGKLEALHQLDFFDLCSFLLSWKTAKIYIENSNLDKGNWHGASARGGVGKNKGLSKMLVEFLKKHQFKYRELKPNGYSILGKHKELFESESGWVGSSNKDQRAAYFIGKAGMQMDKFESKIIKLKQ